MFQSQKQLQNTKRQGSLMGRIPNEGAGAVSCHVLADVTNTFNFSSQRKQNLNGKDFVNMQPDYYSEHSTSIEDLDNNACQDFFNGDTGNQQPENENDQDTILNSTLRKPKKKQTDETKFKTEMCKNWSEKGRCNYGTKCKFAHGKQELQDKSIQNKQRYKSKKCNSFHTSMFCPYGMRCLFAHDQSTLEEVKSRCYYQLLSLIPEVYGNGEHPARRLPVFSKISGGNVPQNPWSIAEESNEGEDFGCLRSVLPLSRQTSSNMTPWECTETYTMELLS